MSGLRDNFGDFQPDDTEIWAVSTDAATGQLSQSAFVATSVFDAARCRAQRVLFVRRRANAIRIVELSNWQSVSIDKGAIARALGRDVAPETHGEDLLARLQLLKMIPT